MRRTTNSFSVFAATTANVGLRTDGIVHGFIDVATSSSVTQIAGGGLLCGDTGVYNEADFDPNTGDFSGTLVDTAPDGVSTLTQSVSGVASAGTLTETLTVTGGTGAFAGAAGSGADQGASNGVLLLTSSGTLYLPGAVNTYNAASWNNQITGNTSDNTEAGLQGVTVSLQDTTTNLYWDGTSARLLETYLPATLGSGGTWSLAVPHTALADGNGYTVHALATDGAGNAQATPGAASFIYDITAPATPPAPTLDPGSDSGVVGDGITNVSTPTLDGTAEANSSVQITDNGVFLGQAVAAANGKWTFTVGGLGSDVSTLAPGAHSITVTATDAAGNVSAPSSALALAIVAPVVTGISPSLGSAGGGTVVTITGTDLGNASAVEFGGPGHSVPAIDFVSDTPATRGR